MSQEDNVRKERQGDGQVGCCCLRTVPRGYLWGGLVRSWAQIAKLDFEVTGVWVTVAKPVSERTGAQVTAVYNQPQMLKTAHFAFYSS